MAKQNSKDLVQYSDKKFSTVAVDNYAKRAYAYFQEMVMLSHQVDRHERWLEEIADKVGLKLKH